MQRPPLRRALALSVWAILMGWVIVVGAEPATWYYDFLYHERPYDVRYNWFGVVVGVVCLTLEWGALYRLLIWSRITIFLRVVIATILCVVLSRWGPGALWTDSAPVDSIVPDTQPFLLLGILLYAVVVGAKQMAAQIAARDRAT